MTSLLLSALLPLLLDPPAIGPADTYKIYFGTTSGALTNVASFTATNRVVLTNVPVGRVYVACSAVNSTGESELSSEIAVQVFVGDVQVGETVSGPWTNYLPISIAVEITPPMKVIRTKLRVQ